MPNRAEWGPDVAAVPVQAPKQARSAWRNQAKAAWSRYARPPKRCHYIPDECAVPQVASEATVAVLPSQNCRLAAVPALPSQARCPQSAPPVLPSDAAEPMPSQVAVSAAVSKLPSCSQPGAPVPGELPAGAPPMLPTLLPKHGRLKSPSMLPSPSMCPGVQESGAAAPAACPAPHPGGPSAAGKADWSTSSGAAMLERRGRRVRPRPAASHQPPAPRRRNPHGRARPPEAMAATGWEPPRALQREPPPQPMQAAPVQPPRGPPPQAAMALVASGARASAAPV